MTLNAIEQPLLAVEIVVQTRERHSSGATDVPHGSGFKTVLRKNLSGMLEDVLEFCFGVAEEGRGLRHWLQLSNVRSSNSKTLRPPSQVRIVSSIGSDQRTAGQAIGTVPANVLPLVNVLFVSPRHERLSTHGYGR